jgi:adenine-specific DNA-methyltransferase
MKRAENLALSFDSDLAFRAPALPKHIPEPAPKSLQSQLGQYMTPATIAAFMARMFTEPLPATVRLLDAGAGRGALTGAFITRWKNEGGKRLEAHAYEFDGEVAPGLQENLKALEDGDRVTTKLIPGDFIENAATMLRLQQGPRYTHAILNPPYKKINSGSRHRELLRLIGLETVNLYTGFVGLCLYLLEPGGQLVAIIPRSFCNGPYYKPFRAFMLRRAAIRHLHLFESRNKAFKEDAVLQENVIISLERGAVQGDITISTSTDDSFADYSEQKYRFGQIVFADDPESFIHIPTEELGEEFDGPSNFRFSLADIGVNVSTGPVVDFRLRDWLRPMPEKGTVPLLYSGHFTATGVEWPIATMKKPNAIHRNAETEKWLYPNGFYAVVRRFSSKEEKRRIVSTVIDPKRLPGEVLGFENHLNVFHQGRRPLPEYVARGLSVFLNSTAVDKYFRRFNGHTQVNATDLKLMKYPDRETLVQLGAWAKEHSGLTQEIIDQKIRTIA